LCPPAVMLVGGPIAPEDEEEVADMALEVERVWPCRAEKDAPPFPAPVLRRGLLGEAGADRIPPAVGN